MCSSAGRCLSSLVPSHPPGGSRCYLATHHSHSTSGRPLNSLVRSTHDLDLLTCHLALSAALMPWKQCKKCKWWQKHSGPCAGCAQSSSSTSAMSAAQTPITTASLQERWNQAKRGSMDPKHTKVERMCPTCFLRTVGKAPQCRGCRRSLEGCLQIFPCQWPPIGASAALLAAYDGSSPPAGSPVAAKPNTGDEPMPEATSPTPGASPTLAVDDLTDLSPPQLRAEIGRLEAVLHGWQQAAFPGLRTQLEEALARAKRELTSRRSTGRTLDQAESRHKQTQQATQLAEQQLVRAQQTVQVAQDALRQARDNEQQALQELTRLKSQIAEQAFETPVQRPDIPAQVLAGVFAVLQHAGLQPEYLHKVGCLLGSDMPPSPPQAMAPAPVTPPQAAAPATPQPKAAAQPSVLSQLLASQRPRLSRSADPHHQHLAARTGRSPPRRPLPKRTDTVDYATTALDSTQDRRDTSRTPDRDAKVPRHQSPPSSLQGVAPAQLSLTQPMSPVAPPAGTTTLPQVPATPGTHP